MDLFQLIFLAIGLIISIPILTKACGQIRGLENENTRIQVAADLATGVLSVAGVFITWFLIKDGVLAFLVSFIFMRLLRDAFLPWVNRKFPSVEKSKSDAIDP